MMYISGEGFLIKHVCLCFLILTLYYDLYQSIGTSWIHWNLTHD